MKTVILLLVLGAVAWAIPTTKTYYTVADKALLEKQKDIFKLFNYIHQPSYYKDFVEIANSFKFEGHWDLWTKPEYAKEFYYYYQHDILPQGEVFSIFYPEHLEQAVALYKTFYYAKDYETFYKTAVWARQHVNEGMFVYAFSVAVVHSQWTHMLVLPPIHEIYPHYFFADEVIYKAHQYKQHYWGTYDHDDEIKDKDYKGYTIHANYSGWYMNVHPEQSMTYYTEDIGINSNYYYYHIYNPFWMHSEDSYYDFAHRGEYFYWFHHQRLARYYLERLSNGMGEIPHFSYLYPIETGYYPSLTYHNGLKFPTRPSHAHLYYHGTHGEQSYAWYGNYSHSYTYVMDYERRLRDALDMGYFYTPSGQKVSLFDKEGFEILGNLVQSNPDSYNERYYGDLLIFSHHLLGYAYFPLDEYKLAPAALEHFETAMRDPMFYQLYKRIMYYFHQHQHYDGPYEHEELYWDGVKIDDITVDRLITYFDYHYSDISNAVVVDEKEFEHDTFDIRARQHRLNHKPFNYKIHVTSDKPTEAFVKVFIGPKYDEYGREISIDDNRHNFFEIDRFHYTLTVGKNEIIRSSEDNSYFSHDRSTYSEIYEHVLNSIKGGSEFKLYNNHFKYYGFPQRFMLPKGDFGGKTFQFYAVVVPYHASSGNKESFGHELYVDTEYSLNYPFDKPIEFEHEFYVPNSYFKDVVIYHKEVEEGVSTTWTNH